MPLAMRHLEDWCLYASEGRHKTMQGLGLGNEKSKAGTDLCSVAPYRVNNGPRETVEQTDNSKQYAKMLEYLSGVTSSLNFLFGSRTY